MNQSERRMVLIRVLLNEHPEYQELRIPTDADTQRQLLRGLLNIREPRRIGTDFLQIQDEYLQAETAAKGITDAADLVPLQPGLYLWQGDITTLKCDAIVNAANNGMTGCYCPNHGCIDNAIHTYAGVQLRLACAEIMDRQRHPEPTGQAKITPAFDLPCRYEKKATRHLSRQLEQAEAENAQLYAMKRDFGRVWNYFDAEKMQQVIGLMREQEQSTDRSQKKNRQNSVEL